jgi:transposase-like protein
MPYAETQAVCEELCEQFHDRYHRLAPKAVERLEDDWERLVTFYQFPREPWIHLQTTTVMESPFTAVRLRTTAAKRFNRVENATTLIGNSCKWPSHSTGSMGSRYYRRSMRECSRIEMAENGLLLPDSTSPPDLGVTLKSVHRESRESQRIGYDLR